MKDDALHLKYFHYLAVFIFPTSIFYCISQTSYDLLLGEKNALESKYKESLDTLVGQHQVEKEYFMRNMEHLETQKSVFQSDKKAMESQIDAIHQQLEQVKQEVHKTITSPEMKVKVMNVNSTGFQVSFVLMSLVNIPM